MEEIWKPVVGYEGWYEISNIGRIKRTRRGLGTWSGRLIKHGMDKRGYRRVTLSRNGKIERFLLYHLVAIAFIGPREKGKEINHIDGNPSNNRVDNLEWCTRSENALHAFRSLGRKPSYKSKIDEEQVRKIRLMIKQGCSQTYVRKIFGLSAGQVSRIHTRKRWASVV
jgi:hypothetical protein